MITGARSRAAAWVAVAILASSACGSGSPAPGSSPAAAGGPLVNRSAAGDAFGYAPDPAAPVTYQSDVVRVGGGPEAVRSVSGDGLTWTIDARADGADDLEVDRVMVMTSRGVGRVAALQRSGDDLLVTLIPVQLTEIFRDAHLALDTDVDLGASRFQVVPDQPGVRVAPDAVRATPSPTRASRSAAQTARAPGTRATVRNARVAASDLALTMPALRLVAAGKRRLPPPVPGRSAAVTIDKWTFKEYETGPKMGLQVTYNDPVGLRVGVDFSLGVRKLHLRGRVDIAGGTMASPPTFVLDGLENMAVDLVAGSANGLPDNAKLKLDIPIEINEPIAWVVPLNFAATWKFSLGAAFTSANSTLKAGGEWGLAGPIGVDAGTPLTPTLTVQRSFINSITGISLTPAGLTMAFEAKYQFGLGIPKFMAGPYVKLIASFGVTNGSALGAPLARCAGASLVGKIGVGAGISLSTEALDFLKALVGGKRTLGIALEKEALVTFIDRSAVVPDVPLCRA